MKALYAQRQHEHQQQLELTQKQQQEEEEESARYYQQYLQSLASGTEPPRPSPKMKRSSSSKNARVDFAGGINTEDLEDEKDTSSSSSADPLWKTLSLPAPPSTKAAAKHSNRSSNSSIENSSLQAPNRYSSSSASSSSGEMKTMDMRSSLLQGGRPLSTVREGMSKDASPNNRISTATSRPPPRASNIREVKRPTSSPASKISKNSTTPAKAPPPPEPTLTYWEKQRERLLKKWHKPPKYRILKLIQLLFGAYIVIMSFTHVGTFGDVGGLVDPVTGWIIDLTSTDNTNKGVILVNGDFRAVVAQTEFQMVALAISRLSAFTMYPGTLYFLFLYIGSCIDDSDTSHFSLIQ